MHIVCQDNQGQLVEHSFQIDISKTLKDLKEFLQRNLDYKPSSNIFFTKGNIFSMMRNPLITRLTGGKHSNLKPKASPGEL
jgi:hypothetical protein